MVENLTPIQFERNELEGVTVCGYQETLFFSMVNGQLSQWIEVKLKGEDRRRKLVSLQIRSDDKTSELSVAIREEQATVRCFAPALWPDPPDKRATLTVSCGGRQAIGTITIGTHRPWTLYLLSDCCADDSWAYANLEEHDRDDYLTTLAELTASEDNCYNYPSVYQVTRFFEHASSVEKVAFTEAVREGRHGVVGQIRVPPR